MKRHLVGLSCILLGLQGASALLENKDNANRIRRKADPQGLFRDNVSPDSGGKIPESALLREELNRIDSIGLDTPETKRMAERLNGIPLPEKIYHYKKPSPYDPYSGHDVHESYDPYSDHKPIHDSYSPYKTAHDTYDPYEPHHDSYDYKAPHSSYEPEPYKPPKGPVLLDERPHEVKEIKPVTISLKETYTGFDCRSKPYPDRHYADPDSGCSIYHFCHADGKHDTFHCPYGTIFNEYLGTCDHSSSVYCQSGDGYAKSKQAKSSYKEPHHSYYKEPHHTSYLEPHHTVYKEPHYDSHRKSGYDYDPYKTSKADYGHSRAQYARQDPYYNGGHQQSRSYYSDPYDYGYDRSYNYDSGYSYPKSSYTPFGSPY